jgi:hypothetical protein
MLENLLVEAVKVDMVKNIEDFKNRNLPQFAIQEENQGMKMISDIRNQIRLDQEKREQIKKKYKNTQEEEEEAEVIIVPPKVLQVKGSIEKFLDRFSVVFKREIIVDLIRKFPDHDENVVTSGNYYDQMRELRHLLGQQDYSVELFEKLIKDVANETKNQRLQHFIETYGEIFGRGMIAGVEKQIANLSEVSRRITEDYQNKKAEKRTRRQIIQMRRVNNIPSIIRQPLKRTKAERKKKPEDNYELPKDIESTPSLTETPEIRSLKRMTPEEQEEYTNEMKSAKDIYIEQLKELGKIPPLESEEFRKNMEIIRESDDIKDVMDIFKVIKDPIEREILAKQRKQTREFLLEHPYEEINEVENNYNYILINPPALPNDSEINIMTHRRQIPLEIEGNDDEPTAT